MNSCPVHPLKNNAKILLASVFGPYAQDDEYGSRSCNPMELYQNQVTRTQGPFSLRMFHRSFGLKMLQENIDAPCTLLDFPDLQRFVEEIQTRAYDIIGISAIAPNVAKVREMCNLIRAYQPQTKIVIGGHIANREDLPQVIDADHIVRGDGIRWLRRYLGQDEDAPIHHPAVSSGFGTRCLGITLPDPPGATAAILIPSVGCPLGCNFCSTSAMFGGKGKSVVFYKTGDELYAVMERISKRLKVKSFFVLDENFLLERQRALRLLELMQKNRKSWSLYVFTSARVLQSYTMEQLVGLGVSWVWMGLEGEESRYAKLRRVDTRRLVRTMQQHGIRVLGSSIIGLEHHTPENIEEIIDYAVSHDTDFHQFMLYTPVPGTPLHRQYQEKGVLLPETDFNPADAHGQYRFNYRHEHIHDGQEESYILAAFEKDFRINGPSLARLIGTTLTGWLKYRNHPDLRVRERFALEKKMLQTTYAGSVWAMRKYYRSDSLMYRKLDDLYIKIIGVFGWRTRLLAPVLGRAIYITLKREEKRLAGGWSYEPPMYYEKNARALDLERADPAPRKFSPVPFRWIPARVLPLLTAMVAMILSVRK